MTGDAAILALKYAEGSTGPETIVLKYAKDLEANRVLAQEANMYEKETFFYRELHRSAAAAAAAASARTSAPNAALPLASLAEPVLPVPGVIDVFVDPEKPKEFFCIAMEDLNSTGFETCDQIVGMAPNVTTQPSPSQRSCAALTLAVGARRTACCWRRMWGAFTRSSGTMSSSSTR